MDTALLQTVEKDYLRKDLPKVQVGDTVAVTTIIRDNKGEKRRSQSFRGLVIDMKGAGTRKTVTVRKISYGIGVEKIFPVNSPNIETIELLKRGEVKQSNIKYMRDRVGRSAMKVREGEIPTEGAMETEIEVEEETVAADEVENQVTDNTDGGDEQTGTQEEQVEVEEEDEDEDDDEEDNDESDEDVQEVEEAKK